MRVGEALALEWRDVHLQPAADARCGFIHVRSGKSKNAKRNISLTSAAHALLAGRPQTTRWVFTNEQANAPLSIFTLEDQHTRTRALLRLPADFVIHGLRHTMLTRLGEAGADAFSLMRIAGHSTVTVSQKYVHPTPESLERAFERLKQLNTRQQAALPAPERQVPATVPATSPVPENAVVQ